MESTRSSDVPVPSASADREQAIDVLRGVAVLGILYMNIQSFAMIDAAYFNPTVTGDFRGVEYTVWLVGRLLFDLKFMALFSALFGAGVVLMTARYEATGRNARALHYRRSGWLLVIGVAHAYLLWHGDILVYYALIAMVIYPFRKLSPRWLIVLGCLLLSVAPVLMFLSGLSYPYWPAEDQQAWLREDWQPPEAVVAHEIVVFHGGYLGQLAHRAPIVLGLHFFVLPFFLFWRIGGLMLVGMALHKWGVFTARCSNRAYGGMLLVALCVGLPLVGWGIYLDTSTGWSTYRSFFIYAQLNYVGSLFVALGWVGAVMLICKNAPHWRGLIPFAATGRMALTNYLFQTIACTALFYGLDFFAMVPRIGQVGIVVAVWIFQVWFSTIWLRQFRFGPFEWLWRCLTYGRLQPFRKAA